MPRMTMYAVDPLSPAIDSTTRITMHAIKLVLLAALAAATLPAAAQWQWVDAQGRKVFSDRAPPADIPARNILRQPSGSAPAAPEAPSQPGTAAPAVPAAPAATAAPTGGTDKALEEQKRKAEAQEAAKAKAEQARVARERKDNCASARQSRSTLTSGQLLAHTNAQGERGFMDEDARAAALKRADAVIASNCDAR